MSGILIKDEADKHGHNETIEKNILRKVIRESWHQKTGENNVDAKITQVLDEHAAKMESLLGSFDYGALCMPNILQNSKRMSYKELVAYLSLLESLGIGYKHWFNSEFANIFLAGLIMKARDTNAITRHLNAFMTGIEKRMNYYKLKSEKENKNLDALIIEYEARNSGLFKFLRKREVNLLRRMITSKTRRIKRLSKKKERYSGLVAKVKGQRS